MQIYKLYFRKENNIYYLAQPEFDVCVSAGTMEKAIHSMKEELEKKGLMLLENGQTLPVCSCDSSEDEKVVFIQVDIEQKFREQHMETVRRNISMPGWLDLHLRKEGVDASKLFQEAAMAYLEEKNKVKEVVYQPITNVDELIRAVPEDILKEYVMRKFS